MSGPAQWAYLLRVKQLLIERHPAVWRQIRSRRWTNDFDTAQRFAWSRELRTIDDAELNKTRSFYGSPPARRSF